VELHRKIGPGEGARQGPSVKQKMVAALEFQTFYTAKATLAGMEVVHMIRKAVRQAKPGRGGANVKAA